jgi:hypothetical protein
MAKQRKTKDPESDRLTPEERGHVAGNAQRLPGEQTCRDDRPPGQEQESCNEPARGTASPTDARAAVGDPAGARGPVDEDAQRLGARSRRNAEHDE